MSARDRLIVALDVPSDESARHLADSLSPDVSWFKLGLELFAGYGPALVSEFVAQERNIFLDLKLHDIPATVGRTTKRLCQLGASLLTVHSGGGLAMMQAAVQEASAATKPMGILAVTVLTSMDAGDLKDVGVNSDLQDCVLRRADLAVKAGCAGVVASPLEAALLRARVPHDFLIVTPGIRPGGASAADDQKRTLTPAQARKAGADKIVVGRPIRDAEDPRQAARKILEEMSV